MGDQYQVALPPILRLPIELRHQIYSNLILEENVSHPLPSVGITSVSHQPPSSCYLLIHPTITAEIVDYFYSIASWKMVLSHAFNFFRIDPNLENLEASWTLKRIRKVDLVFFQDILLLKEYPSFGLEKFSSEIRRRADRACDVLLQAPELRSVLVSWIDTTPTGDWETKARILEPLKKLAGCVRFRVGKLISPDAEDEPRFLLALNAALCCDGAEDGMDSPLRKRKKQNDQGLGNGRRDEHDPFYLRHLAFDVRQERKLCCWLDDETIEVSHAGHR